ncbi:hypothetical protein EDD11_008247 [Mortierella claussenii]|nr:hypothetical protein EDD11_008247 [Mortierella claussenii]
MGMLASSSGQFQASLLCREYLNRHSSNTTLSAITGVVAQLHESGKSIVALRPAPVCQLPEIQAFTAKILALIEVLTGIASTFSIGYYSSLSDKHGRRIIMVLAFFSSFLNLAGIVVMGMFWDQVGLPLMIMSGLVNGLLGGTSLGLTMALAYAADCTDPAKRSLAFSWIHAALYMGLALGPFIGGTIARATDTILTVVFLDMAVTTVCLLLTAVLIPESLPAKQPEEIQRLYESFAKKNEAVSSTITPTPPQERVAWHSHVVRSLSFFKPNGRNTNLVLLAAISFLAMLAYRGTLSVIILYTNKRFNWTEYEDGIMFALSSLVRLFTILIVLPVLVHLHQKSFEKKRSKSLVKDVSAARRESKQPYQQQEQQQKQQEQQRDIDHLVSGYSQRSNLRASVGVGHQAVLNPNDATMAASVQYLGETALDLSDNDDDEEEDSENSSAHRHRQISVDSISTLAPGHNRNTVGAGASSSSASSATPASSPSAADAAPRTREQTFSDMKFGTWMVRLGFVINSVTYIGYGLAQEGWMFYLATALHAACIISMPSLKSLLTNLVEPSQFGAVLGALQVVDSIAAICSPVVISWVYALTVKSMPEFVWYSCAAWAGICVVLSFMIRQKQFRNNMDIL